MYAIRSYYAENNAFQNYLDIFDCITGTVPGVAVSRQTSPPSVTIRGATSMYASTEPLYILNGMPTSVDIVAAISPINVKSISVINRITSYNVCYTKLLRTITVQAESYSSMGGVNQNGTMGGKVGTIGSITYMYEIVSTDWLQYTVTVPTAGYYSIAYTAASDRTNQNIQCSVDGTTVGTQAITQTGSLTTFGSTTASVGMNLTAGTHTIKLTATGTYIQWNLDKFILTRTGALKEAQAASMAMTEVLLYPNPASDLLNVWVNGTLSTGAYIQVYHSSGALAQHLPLEYSEMQLNTAELANGVYILKVINGSEVVTQRFMKN